MKGMCTIQEGLSLQADERDQYRDTANDLPIDESYSPLLHRIESAVRYRAVHPNDPVLDSSDRLTKFAHPSEETVKKSKQYLDKLIVTADVKKGKQLQLPIGRSGNLIRLQFHQKQKAANVNAKPRNPCLGWMSMRFSIRNPNAPRSPQRMPCLSSSRCSRALRACRPSTKP